jgi:hypothetical protein
MLRLALTDAAVAMRLMLRAACVVITQHLLSCYPAPAPSPIVFANQYNKTPLRAL